MAVSLKALHDQNATCWPMAVDQKILGRVALSRLPKGE
jgi:hypothetical protein